MVEIWARDLASQAANTKSLLVQSLSLSSREHLQWHFWDKLATNELDIC